MLIKRKELEKVLSPRIETDRLILRRFKESDIDMQYDILHDDRLATYIHFPDLTKEEELECIKKWINEVPCKLYFLLDAGRGALTIRHDRKQEYIAKKIEDILKNYHCRIVKDFSD